MDILLNKLWRVNIICCAGIAITLVYELSGITSALFYASFFITAVSMWLCMRKNVTVYSRNTIVVLLFIVLFGLISVFQGNLSFSYLKKFIIYLTALISFYVATKMRANKRTIVTLLGSNALVSVLYIWRSQADGAYIQDLLWLFFSNPNFAGMWLYMSLVLLVATIYFVRKKIWKCVLLAGSIYLGYLCFQTGARNIWFAIGYAVLLSTVCVLSKTTKYKGWIIFAVNVFPLVFALGYTFSIENNLISESIAEVFASDGKVITSRYAVWKTAFTYIKQYPIFGAYSRIGGGSGSFQLHNTHIDMWAAYGTVGLILFLVYIYRIIKEVNDSCKTKGAMFAIAGFMCMTLMGSAEASLYATGMGMYIYVSSFLILANYMNQKQQYESSVRFDRVNPASNTAV